MWPPTDNEFARWQPGPVNWLDIVCATVGWGYGDSPPGRRQAYLDLIAPHDSPAAQRQYGQLSGCALSALGWLRCWGLDDAELWAPYRVGMAVADLVTIARRHDAWEPGGLPGIGDLVLVETPEHVLCCLEVRDGVCTSVDGGQLDAMGQCIKLCRRAYRESGGRRWIGSRRVAGVVRVGKMAPVRGQVRATVLARCFQPS